jgi:hypothetical protein
VVADFLWREDVKIELRRKCGHRASGSMRASMHAVKMQPKEALKAVHEFDVERRPEAPTA